MEFIDHKTGPIQCLPESVYDGVFTFCSHYVPYVKGMDTFDGVKIVDYPTTPEVSSLIVLTNDGKKILCPGESLLNFSYSTNKLGVTTWKFLLPTRFFAFMQKHFIEDKCMTIQFFIHNRDLKQVYVYDKHLGGVESIRSILLRDGRIAFSDTDFAFILQK